MLSAVPEQTNIVDKYAVSVQPDDEVVGHLMKGKSGRFAKTIFYFCVPIRRTPVLLWGLARQLTVEMGKGCKCHAH